MDLGLEGKTALVTGGSHGIGLAIARGLEREGCGVHIAARRLSELMKAVRESFDISSMVWTHQFDALEPPSVDHLAREILEVGGVDILVNNVGGGGRWGRTLLETPIETWDQVYQKNTRVAVQLTRALLPTMLQRGWGRVVTISSIHGREGGGRAWFAAAKAAEIAVMKSMSNMVLPEQGVTFNSVAPGYIWIEGKDTEPSRGTPEDVAAAVVFLCSIKAKHINGACLVVDGGEGKAF